MSMSASICRMHASLVASVETGSRHFSPFADLFRSSTRSVEDSAKRYLRGLFQARRRNMERMAEMVAGSHYQRLQHMLSVSDWDHAGVVRQVAVQAKHTSQGSRALVIDESGFAKKGDCSAGVARQWNGRLGKVDNSQVGVFAALARGETACLVDAELFLTEVGWPIRGVVPMPASRGGTLLSQQGRDRAWHDPPRSAQRLELRLGGCRWRLRAPAVAAHATGRRRRALSGRGAFRPDDLSPDPAPRVPERRAEVVRRAGR